MRSAFRETKRQIDEDVSRRSLQRDGEGRVLLDMTVKDDSDFLSVFSESDTPVISSAVADFIEARTRSVPLGEELTLRIHSDCIDDQEQVIYRKAIKEYYTEKYIANRREIHRNTLISVALLIFGVLMLAIAIGIGYREGSAVRAEVVDIVAWVLIWEAVDITFLENRSLRWQEKRCLACIDMKIEYVGVDSKHTP